MEKEEMKEKLKEIAVKNFNVVGFGSDLLDLILEPALEKMVSDSANPYDDVAKDALYPVLAPLLKKVLEEKVAEALA